MADPNNKPNKNNGSAPKRTTQPRIVTMDQIRNSGQESERQAYFAGGSETSGQQILGGRGRREDSNHSRESSEALAAAFRRAAAGSESHEPSSAAARPQESRLFVGAGHRLGDTETPNEEPEVGPQPAQDPENPARVVLTLWENGYTLDNGPILSYDHPRCAELMANIDRGELPTEFLPYGRPGPVHLAVIDKRAQKFKESVKVFGGKGHKLGSPTPPVSATQDESASEVTPMEIADEEEPSGAGQDSSSGNRSGNENFRNSVDSLVVMRKRRAKPLTYEEDNGEEEKEEGEISSSDEDDDSCPSVGGEISPFSEEEVPNILELPNSSRDKSPRPAPGGEENQSAGRVENPAAERDISTISGVPRSPSDESSSSPADERESARMEGESSFRGQDMPNISLSKATGHVVAGVPRSPSDESSSSPEVGHFRGARFISAEEQIAELCGTGFVTPEDSSDSRPSTPVGRVETIEISDDEEIENNSSAPKPGTSKEGEQAGNKVVSTKASNDKSGKEDSSKKKKPTETECKDVDPTTSDETIKGNVTSNQEQARLTDIPPLVPVNIEGMSSKKLFELIQKNEERIACLESESRRYKSRSMKDLNRPGSSKNTEDMEDTEIRDLQPIAFIDLTTEPSSGPRTETVSESLIASSVSLFKRDQEVSRLRSEGAAAQPYFSIPLTANLSRANICLDVTDNEIVIEIHTSGCPSIGGHDVNDQSEHGDDDQSGHEGDSQSGHEGDNQSEHESDNQSEREVDPRSEHEISHQSEHEGDDDQSEHEVDHQSEHEIDSPSEHEADNHSEYEMDNQSELESDDQSEHESDNLSEHESDDHSENESDNHSQHESDNPSENESDNQSEHEVQDETDHAVTKVDSDHNTIKKSKLDLKPGETTSSKSDAEEDQDSSCVKNKPEDSSGPESDAE